jgi:hypothetical protein
MSTADPFIMGSELEAGQIRVLLDSVHSGNELVYVHTIDLGRGLDGHLSVSFLDNTGVNHLFYTIILTKSYSDLNWPDYLQFWLLFDRIQICRNVKPGFNE